MQTNNLNNIVLSLNKYIESINNIDSLSFSQNKLECLCLNIASKEISEYKEFVDRLINNTNENLAKEIEFKIITNNTDAECFSTKDLRIFKNVELINLNLKEEEDIYIRPEDEEYHLNNKNYIYGTKSGPNTMFLKSMKILKNYNSSLLLESDCFFSKDWLEKIINYVNYSNGFWISGPIYDGSIVINPSHPTYNHINGVAIYATGNKNFQIFIDCFEEFLKEYIKFMPNLAYDVGIKIFIKKNIDSGLNYSFWKFVNRNYVVNKYIFNYSTTKDSFFDEEKIMKIYNYAILHKKNRINFQ